MEKVFAPMIEAGTGLINSLNGTTKAQAEAAQAQAAAQQAQVLAQVDLARTQAQQQQKMVMMGVMAVGIIATAALVYKAMG